jgi:hypothetical protein
MTISPEERERRRKTLGKKQTHDRFWSKVDVQHPYDCWEWTGSANRGRSGERSYGRFVFNRRRVLAHRHAYFLTYGPFAEPVIRHRCDNPLCVNPMHLVSGGASDNARDAFARGLRKRFDGRQGTQHPMAILTEDDIPKIRADHRPHAAIAADYGVTKSAIALIRQGKTWRHVP